MVQPKASLAGNRSLAGYFGEERQQGAEEIWNEARFQIQPRGHDRITILFDAGGSREVLADRWTIQRTWQRPGQWRGYTLLRVATTSERPTANPASGDVAAANDVESDGSYDVVTDLDGQRP